MRPADKVVVRPLAGVRRRGQNLPALVGLLVAAQIADRIEEAVLRVGLHHDRVMLKDDQRLVVKNALFPQADVAERAGHLASGHVVVGHLDHSRDAAVRCRRLDGVLDSVVGVPVHPRHASQIAALGGSLCFDLGRFVAPDADDVRC